MARILHPLALTLILLTEPAYAANKIALLCTGIVKANQGNAQDFKGSILVDFDQRTITVAPPGVRSQIADVTESGIITFSGSYAAAHWIGTLNRYTGVLSAVMSVGSEYNQFYDLTCKSAQPLF